MKKILIFLSLLCALSYGNIPAFATESRPKNIIIFIADGGGYPQMALADIWAHGKTGTQAYESFPVSLSMATFPKDGEYSPEKINDDPDYLKQHVTDSAAAATAMATGHKTVKKAIGTDAGSAKLANIMEAAQKAGISTGVITSVEFSHATPAGFTAHTENREKYLKIARQMIYESRLNVIMGCGHPLFTDNSSIEKYTDTPVNEYKYRYVGGSLTWEDLSDGFVMPKTDFNGDGAVTAADAWKVIQSKQEFTDLINTQTPPVRVIGIPRAHTTLQQKRSASATAAPFEIPFNKGVPSLREMTLAALNVLNANANGFVLMTEGGAIDWACHENNAARVIEEFADFNAAVDAAIQWTEDNSSWKDTLIIVTADHETGYLKLEDAQSYTKGKMPPLSWHHYYHTNSLVPFYAKGAGSEFFEEEIAGEDPDHDKYIDNTAIAKVIFELLEGQKAKIKKQN